MHVLRKLEKKKDDGVDIFVLPMYMWRNGEEMLLEWKIVHDSKLAK